MMKKILSILLSVVMALSLTMPAFAITGSGTPEDPLIIEDVHDLLPALEDAEIKAVRLGEDIDVQNMLLVPLHSLTLDLAGKRLYNESNENVIFELNDSGCTLTITDSSQTREGQIDSLQVNGSASDARVNLNGGVYTNRIGFSGEVAVRIGGGFYPEEWSVDQSCDFAVTGGCFWDEQVSRYCAEGYSVGPNPLEDLYLGYPFAVSAEVGPDNTFDLKTGCNTFRMAPGEENAVTVTFTPEESGRYSFTSACEVCYDPCATVDGDVFEDGGTDLNFSFDRVLTAGEPFTFSVQQQQTEGRECLFRLDVEKTSAAFVPVTFDLQGKGDNVTVEVETGTSAWVACWEAFPLEDPSWDGYRLVTFSRTPIEGEPTADQLAALNEAFDGETVTEAVTYYAVWVEEAFFNATVTLGENTFALPGEGSGNAVTVTFTPAADGWYQFTSTNEEGDPYAVVDGEGYEDNGVGNNFTFKRELTADEPFSFVVWMYVNGSDYTVNLTVAEVENPYNATVTLGENTFALPGEGSDNAVTVTFTPDADGWYRFESSNLFGRSYASVGDQQYPSDTLLPVFVRVSNFSFTRELTAGEPFSFTVWQSPAVVGDPFKLTVSETEPPVSVTFDLRGMGNNVTVEVEKGTSALDAAMQALPDVPYAGAYRWGAFSRTPVEGEPTEEQLAALNEAFNSETITEEVTYYVVWVANTSGNATVALGENTIELPGGGITSGVLVTFTPTADGWYQFTSTNEDGNPCAEVGNKEYDDNDSGYNFTFKRELTADEPFSFVVWMYDDGSDYTVSLTVAEIEASVMVPVTFDLQGKGENVTVEAETGTSAKEAYWNAFPNGDPTWGGYLLVTFSRTPVEGEPTAEQLVAMREAFNGETVTEEATYYAVWVEEDFFDVTVTLGDNTFATPGTGRDNAVTVTFTPDADGWYQFTSTNEDGDPCAKVDGEAYDDNDGGYNFTFKRELTANEPFSFTVYLYSGSFVSLTVAETEAPVMVPVTFDLQGKGENVTVEVEKGAYMWEAVSKAFPFDPPAVPNAVYVGFSLSSMEDDPSEEAIAAARNEVNSSTVQEPTVVYVVWKTAETVPVTIDLQGRGDPVITYVASGDYLVNAVSRAFPYDPPSAENAEFACYSLSAMKDDPTQEQIDNVSTELYCVVTEPVTVFVVWKTAAAPAGSVNVTIDMGGVRDDIVVPANPGDCIGDVVSSVFPGEYPTEGTQVLAGFTLQPKDAYDDWDAYGRAADELWSTAVGDQDVTVYAGWFEKITPEFTVKAPVCGAQGYFNAPEVTLPEDSHLTFTNTIIPTVSEGMSLHVTEGDPTFWDVSEETVFTAGSRYDCVVALEAEYGYYLSDTAVVNGADDVTVQIFGSKAQYRITVTAAHDYQFDSFVWGESGDTAQAKLVCAVHPDQATYVDAAISEEFHPATAPGETPYTVYTAIYGEYTDQNIVQNPDGLRVIAQPSDSAVAYGEMATATFSVTGDGLTYQWYGLNPGQTEYWASSLTGSTYSVGMVPKKSGRKVYCVVTDKYGNTVTSNIVTLTMEAPEAYALTVIEQPGNRTVDSGEFAYTTFTVSGEGLTYQWYGLDEGQTAFWKSGLKGDTYGLKMVREKAGRKVYCVVTDVYGNKVASDTVTLAIAKPEGYALTVASQPANVSGENGKLVSTTFSVSGDDLTYQWYGRDPGQTNFWKSGLTGDTYSIYMVPKKSGRQVYCVVTDAYGNTVTSDTVTLTME